MKKAMAMLLCVLLLALAAQAGAQEAILAQAKTVLGEMIAGDFDAVAARFDAAMAAALDGQGLAAAWNSVTAQVGPVTGVAAAQADEATRSAALMLTHENGQTVLTIVFDEAGCIAGMLITPQAAAAQFAVRELPAGVQAKAVALFPGMPTELAGELLIPAGAGDNTPYVVLVHGSGPSDMDESIGGCKPLRDLAYDLAALGVGSLRFDKITYAHPQHPAATVEQEYLQPVAEALRVLRGQTGAQRVYLVGHSQGAMLAPYLTQACGFDGAVCLAGTPKQLWEVSYAQNLALLESVPPGAQRALMSVQIQAEHDKALTLLQMTDEEAAAQTVFGVSAVYQRHLAQMDQAQIALESGKPFLFLWGERDFQVDRAAFDAWGERLGSDARFAYKTYPGLNHLFMPAGEEDSILNAQAAYQQAKVMDAQVGADIAAWIFDRQAE